MLPNLIDAHDRFSEASVFQGWNRLQPLRSRAWAAANRTRTKRWWRWSPGWTSSRRSRTWDTKSETWWGGGRFNLSILELCFKWHLNKYNLIACDDILWHLLTSNEYDEKSEIRKKVTLWPVFDRFVQLVATHTQDPGSTKKEKDGKKDSKKWLGGWKVNLVNLLVPQMGCDDLRCIYHYDTSIEYIANKNMPGHLCQYIYIYTYIIYIYIYVYMYMYICKIHPRLATTTEHSEPLPSMNQWELSWLGEAPPCTEETLRKTPLSAEEQKEFAQLQRLGWFMRWLQNVVNMR